jgi:hypothetical protein
MAATWTIVNTDYQLKSDHGDNLITTLHWQCIDSETVDGVVHSGRLYGSISIPEPSGTFIAYASVTQENCLTWCKAIMGEDKVKGIEDSVAAQIALSKAPVTASGKPW